MKNLVIMPTHIINRGIVDEFSKLKCAGNDCILFLNNVKKVIENTENNLSKQNTAELDLWQEHLKCFVMDEEVFKDMNLPYFPKVKKQADIIDKIMWYNCDYQFYIIKKYFPQYDYYWRIEYDVFCNGKTYKPFFDKYENNKDDLLISDYRKESKDSGWYFSKNVDWLYGDDTPLWAGFYPVVRLSSDAIDFLYKKRQEHWEIFNKAKKPKKTLLDRILKKDKSKHWPICELFTATELKNNGFSASNIDEENIKSTPPLNLNENRIFLREDYKLYHPVKTSETIKIKLWVDTLK